MKLKEIQLRNIGPYVNAKFNFETNADQNVVLICGENGAGKTTLLKSIKLGLFGSFLYGLKQKSKGLTYVDDIKSIIRNNEKKGTIILKFSIVEEYKETFYELKRTWDISNNFKELVDLFVNGKKVSDREFLNKMEYINRYFNPKLIDSMMFDGEKIINYIDDDIFEEYIRENIIYSFGMNYYLDLINDLEKYISEEKKENSLSVEQLKLKELDYNKKSIEKEIDQLRVKKNSLIELEERYQFELNVKLDELKKLGGLSAEFYQQLREKLYDLEHVRSEQSKTMRDFFENNLFLVLNKNLFKKVVAQVEKEKPYKFIGYVNEMLHSDILSDNYYDYLTTIKNELESFDVKKILCLEHNTDEYFNKINEKVKESVHIKKEMIVDDTINDVLIQDVRKRLVDSQQKDTLEILNIIEELKLKLEDVSNELAHTKDMYVELYAKYEILLNQYNELKKEVYEKTKDSDSFVLANKYRDICQKYYDTQIIEITKKVSRTATKILLQTYRKQNYISDIKITPQFEIKAYCGDCIKNLKQLSAGEKQIFVASVMSAIIHISKRNIPLIFDTPAGRLDNQHMAKFFDRIMIRAGHQVIIMPTSKEINKDVIDKIKRKVARCYTLDYQINGTTNILQNRVFEEEWE